MPERVFLSGGGGEGQGSSLSLLNTLLGLLVSDKSGIRIAENDPEVANLEKAIAEAQAQASAKAEAPPAVV